MNKIEDLDKFGRIKLEDVIPDYIKDKQDISDISNNIYLPEDDPKIIAWKKSVEEFEKQQKEKESK